MNESSAKVEDHRFIEMRDKTASRKFWAKKKLDHLLEAALPGIYLPLYTMVTSTRIRTHKRRAARACRTASSTPASFFLGDADRHAIDLALSLHRTLK